MLDTDTVYWISAWVLMGLTFLAIFAAIIGGAKALDRESNENL